MRRVWDSDPRAALFSIAVAEALGGSIGVNLLPLSQREASRLSGGHSSAQGYRCIPIYLRQQPG